MASTVPLARHLGSFLNDREYLVSLVHIVDALEQIGNTFETGTSVDVKAAQWACDVEVIFSAHR